MYKRQPYRKPQIVKTLVHSIFDRTLFVLGRAMAVAAPAGLLIWLMANITIGDATLLTHCAGLLDPFAKLCGLDGYILLAFILGFPANEIVIPILIMSYLASGSMVDYDNILQLKTSVSYTHLHGLIKEMGSHDELMKQKGAYYELYTSCLLYTSHAQFDGSFNLRSDGCL